jgi:hypothetical protein
MPRTTTRRTKEEIARSRQADWDLWATEGWSLFGICRACGTQAHVRGSRRRNVRCHACVMEGK